MKTFSWFSLLELKRKIKWQGIPLKLADGIFLIIKDPGFHMNREAFLLIFLKTWDYEDKLL